LFITSAFVLLVILCCFLAAFVCVDTLLYRVARINDDNYNNLFVSNSLFSAAARFVSCVVNYIKQSRVGAVALYTVLRAAVAKFRKWPFSAPCRTKTPEPIKVKICPIDYVGGTTKRAKVHNDQLGVAAPHMNEVVDCRSVFPVT
jgi:hypothetical protein